MAGLVYCGFSSSSSMQVCFPGSKEGKTCVRPARPVGSGHERSSVFSSPFQQVTPALSVPVVVLLLAAGSSSPGHTSVLPTYAATASPARSGTTTSAVRARLGRE